MPKLTILDRLTQGKPIIADGATGTLLQAAGLPAGDLPESWVLANPGAIEEMHRSYIEAGAELILSCTFGATRPRLERKGLGDKLAEVNARAVALAREAAGNAERSVYVAGDIGPLGEFLAPLGALTPGAAAEIFAEQAAALAEAGAHLIYIETMSDLNEMKAAVAGARRACDLPIFATMSFDAGERTNMGVSPAQAAEALLELEVAALGANCGRSIAENVAAVAAMRAAAPDAHLIAKPNAGLPRLENGRTVFDATPALMAESVPDFLQSGVRVIGGCCGSTPDHIRAIADVARAS